MNWMLLRAGLAIALVLPIASADAGLGGGLFGDDAEPEEPTLDFEFVASHTAIAPDTPLLVAITTTIPDGFHLQDQIELTLDEGAPLAVTRWWHSAVEVRRIGEAEFGEFLGPFMAVYELTPQEPVELNPHALDVVFGYAPCHEDYCYGPREATAQIAVTIGDTLVENPAFKPIREQLSQLVPVAAQVADTEEPPADGGRQRPGSGKEYTRRYDLFGVPNVLLLSADGTEIKRIVGYQGKRVFDDAAKAALAGNQDEAKGASSLVLLLGGALLGGLLAALSPCVYPMIPITMGFLAGQAGGRLSRSLMSTVALGVGIVLPFAAIGAFIGALKGVLFRLTTNAAYILTIDAILVVLIASMLGVFDVQLPASLRNRAAGARNAVGLIGAFVIGLVVVPLAFACTAPALGVIVPFVAGAGVGTAMLVMVVFGLGLAAPFLAVGTFAGALSALPRAGAWMLGVKKVFALLLVGVIFYISRPITAAFPHSAGMLAGVAFIVVALVLGVFKRRVGSYFNRAVAAIGLLIGLNFALGSALVEAERTGTFPLQDVVRLPASEKAVFEWTYDLEAAFEQAQREDKLVMAYFWGYNCPACEKYQKHLWTRPETADALRGFVPVKINVDE